MLVRKIIGFCFSLIGVSCTLPVIDTEYKETLHSPSTFIFKGKVWIMGNYHKTVSKTYNPRLFYSTEDWQKRVHSITSDRVYSLSDGNAILEATLNARFRDIVVINEKLNFEGKVNSFEVFREDKYYIEHNEKIFVVGGRRYDEKNITAGGGGKSIYDDVWFSNDGLNWQMVAQRPPWAEIKDSRDHHRIAGFNGHIYLARSLHAGAGLSAVWRSADGMAWEKITEIPDLKSVRDMFSFRNRLFLLGNIAESRLALFNSDNGKDWHISDTHSDRENIIIVPCNERLYRFKSFNLSISDDGIKWTSLISSSSVPYKIAAYGDKMAALELFKDSAAYSSNGIDWFSEGNTHVFSFEPKDLGSKTLYGDNYPLYGVDGIVEFKDSLWVIGDSPDRIYRSPDGSKWVHVKVRDDKRFIPRSNAAIAVFQNKLWIIGGTWIGELPEAAVAGPERRKVNIYLNDVWSSSDGESWDLVTNKAAWAAGSGSRVALEFRGKLVIIGESRDTWNESDFELWESSDGRAWTRSFSNVNQKNLNVKIRNDFAGMLVHNGMLYLFDKYIGSEFAVSADGRKFSKLAVKEVKTLDNIVSVRIGGKMCYLSKKDESMYMSYDLLVWRDLQFISPDAWQYSKARLFSFHDKLYLVDVDFKRDVQARSFRLKIDVSKMTVAVDER